MSYFPFTLRINNRALVLLVMEVSRLVGILPHPSSFPRFPFIAKVFSNAPPLSLYHRQSDHPLTQIALSSTRTRRAGPI